MEKFVLHTAVAFCVFNRIETTRKVFEVIREAKPPRLYIIADAARKSVSGEKEKVDAVKKYIESNIDWECEVFQNYASENMGCGRRIPDGINWVFKREEQVIILEDDCVPEPSFFRYCEEMLNYYKDDERILMISGNNPCANCHISSEDYLFTKVPFIWGWATWKRAWNLYDFDLKSYPENCKNKIFKQIFPLKAYWTYMAEFEAVYRHRFDAWDYQWLYAGIIHDKLCITPTENHVMNIGICEDSTHTNELPKWMTAETKPVHFPINLRKEVVWDREFDQEYFRIANKHGHIVKIKQLLGLDVNKSIFSILRG